MTNKKIRVMVVDDHTLVLKGTVSLLSPEPGIDVVSVASNAEDCLSQLKTIRPDVLLLDIILPGLSGIDIIAAIKRETPNTQIIMITGEEPQGYIESSLIQGAVGFLLKDCTPDELFEAIRNAAKGESFFSKNLTTKVANDSETKGTELLEQKIADATLLTTREKEILPLLAQGMQNKDIANELHLSKRTVEGHVLNILEKLGFKTRSETAAFYLGLKNRLQ